MVKFAVLFLAVVAVLSYDVASVQGEDAMPMRWCYKKGEDQKCKDLESALQTAAAQSVDGMKVTTTCVNGNDASGCIDKIKKNEADLITLDGGEIMQAESGLVPIVSEKYDETGVSYFAVAVVKKNNTNFGLKDLKGKNTCHTGARRSSGWTIPVGYMLVNNVMPGKNCSKIRDFLSAAKFFNNSCVPGVKTFFESGKTPDNLCAACKGDCSSSNDGYNGYTGAFKCMFEDAGDVAFVKHTTTSEMTSNQAYGNDGDYEYLCKDGTRKAIGQHKDCNLGTSPAHAVVTRDGDSHIDHYVQVLIKLVELYGVNQKNASGFQLFNSSKYSAARNSLFKDSAVDLKKIATKTVDGYMGDYAKDYKALTSCPPATTGGPATTVTAKASAACPGVLVLLCLMLAALMKVL